MTEKVHSVGEVELGVSIDSTAVDEALEKVDALGDATAELAPMVSLRNLRGCTVNVYVSRNTWKDDGDDRD